MKKFNLIRILNYCSNIYDEITLIHCMDVATKIFNHDYLKNKNERFKKYMYAIGVSHALVEQCDLNIKLFCKMHDLPYNITNYIFTNLHNDSCHNKWINLIRDCNN